ncbi:MAG: hypothetical protein ACRECV_00910 [Xanthobacteraceae bacterium]
MINATGADASVAVTSINDATAPATTSLGRITQIALNIGPITNNGNITSTGGLTGTGSSAVINATGASASVAVTSINDATAPATTSLGPITQIALNTSPIINMGNITLGSGGLGIGASAEISAVGASSVVSFTSIK